MDYLNFLRLLAFLYAAALPLALLIGALLLVGVLANGWRAKVFGMFLVLMVPVLLISPQVYKRKQANNIALERYEKANARFQEHCKKAGNFIYRSVENVDAVILLNIFPEFDFNSFDHYSLERGGDAYIRSFLPKLKSPPDDILNSLWYKKWRNYGYRVVEFISPEDGVRYRYRVFAKAVRQQDVNAPAIKKKLLDNPNADINIYEYAISKYQSPDSIPPRYGVLYIKISDDVDRKYWIAGGLLRVFDIKTKEVLGERVEYMMDQGQGDQTNGRYPWGYAGRNVCSASTAPEDRSRDFSNAVDFVEKVLKPRRD